MVMALIAVHAPSRLATVTVTNSITVPTTSYTCALYATFTTN